MEPTDGMTNDRRQPDDPLTPDDPLAQAITQLPEMRPSRDLWSGIEARIAAPTTLRAVETGHAGPVVRRQLVVTWSQLALAASLLMAVTVSLTWLVARQPAGSEPAGAGSREQVVRAVSEPMGVGHGGHSEGQFRRCAVRRGGGRPREDSERASAISSIREP